MAQKTGEKKHIAVSAALNIIRKAFMIAFPLVTYAYATRVLGTEGIGAYEFSQSVVSYFALIAALGITQYAVRDGAKYLRTEAEDENGDAPADGRNSYEGINKRTAGYDMSRFASEVFSINLIMTVVSYAIMTVLVLANPLLHSYSSVIFIYSISILFTTLGVDWINSLFEDYLKLTIRYIVVSVISLGLLLIFVKTPADLNKYVAISIFATVVNGFLNFIYVQRHVRVRFTFNLNLAKHGLPIFILFCNNIASVIYLNSDVTILRVLTDDHEVGLYGVAAKIYTMIKELMNAAIFVTIPRFSMYVNEAESGKSDAAGLVENIEEMNRKYISGLRALLTPLLTVLVPSCLGLAMLAPEVMTIVAGADFAQGAVALRILGVAMFFAVTACFLAYAIIMPYKLERYFLVATCIAAAVNIVLNFILIPLVGMPAAAITTLLAEIMVFTMLGIIASHKVSLKSIINGRDLLAIVVGSVGVVAVCLIKGYMAGGQNVGIIGTFATVAAAVMVYGIVQIVMKNSVVGYVKGLVRK